MTADSFGDGERRKRDALALLEVRRDVYLLRARRRLLTVLLDRGAATIDDVRDTIALPSDIDPKLFGAVPRLLAQLGIIRAAGFATTARVVAHARPVRVWEPVDGEAALVWLHDHPEPAEGGHDPPKTQEATVGAVASPLQRTLF